ncbi:MAG: hypothetical protein WC899_10580 [bacterium]|jgi:3-mercaptopyruvate sulfurtransferase SseA
MKRGYDRVAVIHGGFDAWMRLGLPTQPKGEETTLPAAADGGTR